MQREVREQRAWITRCAAASAYFVPRSPTGRSVEVGRSAWAPAPEVAAAAWTAAWGWGGAGVAPAVQTPQVDGPRTAGRPCGRPIRAPAAVAWVPSELEMRAALARGEREKEKEKDDGVESTCSGNPS